MKHIPATPIVICVRSASTTLKLEPFLRIVRRVDKAGMQTLEANPTAKVVV